MLEPSAGVGGLAVWAHNAGAKTIVNELSPRRSELLKIFPFYKRFTENAEQLHNILPKDVKPNVVLMNPPFSSTGGRIEGQRKTMNATLHIEQALKRLEPGGRLVAIVGRGMSMDTPTFKPWWRKIGQEFNIKADIGISGKEYKKYGTSFDNRIIIIDKSAPNDQNIVRGEVEKVEYLLPLLEGIRNERFSTTKQAPIKQDEPESPEKGEKPARPAQPKTPVQPPADVVGPGSRGDQRPKPRQPDKGDSGGDAVSVEPGERAPVSVGGTGTQAGGVQTSPQKPETSKSGIRPPTKPAEQPGREETRLPPADEVTTQEEKAVEAAEVLEETSKRAPYF